MLEQIQEALKVLNEASELIWSVRILPSYVCLEWRVSGQLDAWREGEHYSLADLLEYILEVAENNPNLEN